MLSYAGRLFDGAVVYHTAMRVESIFYWSKCQAGTLKDYKDLIEVKIWLQKTYKQTNN